MWTTTGGGTVNPTTIKATAISLPEIERSRESVIDKVRHVGFVLRNTP